MNPRRYVIIGGGMAGDAAAKAIREGDPAGSITILCAERHLPYARPPLSKALWKGDAVETIWRGTEKTGATILLGSSAASIDRATKSVTDSKGGAHSYDALLLATGGTPSRFPFGGDDVLYFRSFDDYRKLRELATPGKSFAVIGGGFIGSEIAAALRMTGQQVTLLFPENGLCARIFPDDLSRNLVAFYREKGVDVRPATKVTGISRTGSRIAVTTGSGERIEVDGVVAGIGIRPNTEIAQRAGLTVNDGVVVNDRMQTEDPNVFAAGDIARIPVAAMGGVFRFEHEDCAVTTGRAAGLAMTGQAARYDHVPLFYSDLFELGYEGVGKIDSRMETSALWKEPFKEGTVYYLEGGVIRGVLLVNTWNKADDARKLLGSPGANLTAF